MDTTTTDRELVAQLAVDSAAFGAFYCRHVEALQPLGHRALVGTS